jgi:eukaryotic-like serine/threonine-protein kinase
MEQGLDRFHTVSDLVRALVQAPERPEDEVEAGHPAPGDQVGRFELIREIGRGGHGVVFEARDLELGRLVALKSLRCGAPEGDPAREEALHREAKAVASLHHRNIVTLYEYGRSVAGPYLVLELLGGETLSARLARGPLELTEAVRIAADVARALAHAHARGVSHRDLKPGNVSIGPDGEVTLLDFGIAHLPGCGGRGGGTPGYMAPEQREGRPEDARTDVYALGLLLAEMITGRRPRPPEHRGAPVRLRSLVAQGAPARLVSLVARALANDPGGRPEAAELLRGLEAVARGLQPRRRARRAVRQVG